MKKWYNGVLFVNPEYARGFGGKKRKKNNNNNKEP